MSEKISLCATFNRSMKWLDDPELLDESIIVYSACDRLWLTGKNEVCNWWIEPEDIKYKTVSDKISSIQLESKDPAVLTIPNYEFLIDQHPELVFKVDSGARSWKVKIFFEREFDYSPPPGSPVRTLFLSKSLKSMQELTVPLAKLLRSKGYQTRYMRVRISIILGAGEQTEVSFQVYSKTQTVVVPQLPQTVAITRKPDGIPIHTIAVDNRGQIIPHQQVSMNLTCNGKVYSMEAVAKTGVFRAVVSNLSVGMYQVDIKASLPQPIGPLSASTTLAVTDGVFVKDVFDNQGRHNGYSRGGKHLGFLSGSTTLCDLVPAFRVGTEQEDIILDAEEYKSKSKNSNGKLEGVLLTSLTTDDLNRWLKHRADRGYRLLNICNWPPDLLNVGGKISPYGAELVSYILNFSRSQGIYAKVVIQHDTLCRLTANTTTGGRNILPNLTQYREAGFMRDIKSVMEKCQYSWAKQTGGIELALEVCQQWRRPEIRKIHEEYYRHFLLLFRDDTAIMMFSATGEEDKVEDGVIKSYADFIRSLDLNHLLSYGRGGSFRGRANRPYFDSYQSLAPRESRHPGCSPVDSTAEYKTDIGMAVICKFFGLSPDGISAHGDCFSVPFPPYSHSWDPKYDNIHPWNDEAKLLVRDFLWMCITHRVFIADNWNEELTAGEHIIPAQVSSLMDWDRLVPRVPPVLLRVRTLQDRDLQKMNWYEEVFASCGLDYGYIWGEDRSGNAKPFLLLDIGEDVKTSILENAAEEVPISVQDKHVVRLSGRGYLVSSLLSEGLEQAIIYLRNTTNYVEAPMSSMYYRNRHHWMRGNRKQEDLQIKLVHFPDKPRRIRIYDLDTKLLLLDEKFQGKWEFTENDTNHDYVIIVTP